MSAVEPSLFREGVTLGLDIASLAGTHSPLAPPSPLVRPEPHPASNAQKLTPSMLRRRTSLSSLSFYSSDTGLAFVFVKVLQSHRHDEPAPSFTRILLGGTIIVSIVVILSSEELVPAFTVKIIRPRLRFFVSNIMLFQQVLSILPFHFSLTISRKIFPTSGNNFVDNFMLFGMPGFMSNGIDGPSSSIGIVFIGIF